MYYYNTEIRYEIDDILIKSPIVRPQVISDVRDFLIAGEWGLAFDTICDWIYEDDLTIGREYYEQLMRMAEYLGDRENIRSLEELVAD